MDYKKDKLILISHKNRYLKWENILKDYHKKIPDPFFNESECSTWLCRNTKSNSIQNLIYDYYSNWWKKNIYVIYYGNTGSEYLCITLIFKVLRTKIYKNHESVLKDYNKNHFPNLIYENKRMSKTDFQDYNKRKEHPFIVWKPYRLKEANGKLLPKRYVENLNCNEKFTTWRWKYWNIDVFINKLKTWK